MRTDEPRRGSSSTAAVAHSCARGERRGGSPGRSAFHLLGDLLVGGKALQRLLREQQSAVERDLEDATLGRDQLDLGTREGGLQLGGQTDRLGGVVSLDAVLDLELHGRLGSGGGLGATPRTAGRGMLRTTIRLDQEPGSLLARYTWVDGGVQRTRGSSPSSGAPFLVALASFFERDRHDAVGSGPSIRSGSHPLSSRARPTR